MGVKELYLGSRIDLDAVWNRFIFFDPDMPYLGYKIVRNSIGAEKKDFLLQQLKSNFLPQEDHETVQEEFRKAANMGIDTLNFFCDRYLPNEFNFRIGRLERPLDLFELINKAREDWISARNGKHIPDPNLMFSAYTNVRNFGLGYRVMMIDTTPEVISSLRNYTPLLEWFKEKLDFQEFRNSNNQDRPNTWKTSLGVNLYGQDKPMHSRLKILTEDGKVKYGSILLKMFTKGKFPDQIEDYTGVEFIVEDDHARMELIKYFGNDVMTTGRLEAFKSGNKKWKNKFSGSEFRTTKFYLRIPIKHIFDSKTVYERTPVEVQILTLLEDKIRKENPDATHFEYKKRQFMQVFPAWFPQKIYEPLEKNVTISE